VELHNEIKKNIPNHEFVSCEKLPYLGKKYRLKVQQSMKVPIPTVKFHLGSFYIDTPATEKENVHVGRIINVLEDWYKYHAKKGRRACSPLYSFNGCKTIWGGGKGAKSSLRKLHLKVELIFKLASFSCSLANHRLCDCS
jgi:hypothetical protein